MIHATMGADVPPPPPPPPSPPPGDPAFPPATPQPAADTSDGAGRWVVFGLALLFLGDTFLAWQRVCIGVPQGLLISGRVCVHANAWHGDAGGIGAIAGVAAILLLVWEGARLAGASIDLGPDARTVTTFLAGTVVVAGVLKWALVVGRFAAPGAWIGLLLAAGLAGWVTLRSRAG
jgi:hypothetical protein